MMRLTHATIATVATATRSFPRVLCAALGLAGFVAVILPAVPAAATTPTYRVTDLGDLPGGNDVSLANGINNSGQVVGSSWTAAGYRAFLWTSGLGMQDLGNLGGLGEDDLTEAYGINNSGQVVGDSRVRVYGTSGWTYNSRAFLWTSGSGMQNLGVLPGTPRSTAYGINASGQVVGDSQLRAFRWTSGSGMQNLYLSTSIAYGINDSGQVVGMNYEAGSYRAFRWTSGPEIWYSGADMRYVGDLPGGSDSSAAYGINTSGQVVGVSSAAAGDRAFRWTSGSGTQDLGVLPGGVFSEAYGINASGQVVGRSVADTGTSAFLWTSTDQMVDLNAHLNASGSGWTLQEAKGLNDLGQIVGSGLNPTGASHGFLLTPVISPSAPVASTMPPPSGGNPVDPPRVQIDSRLAVDFPATNGGDFTATFREMTKAQATMDLSNFNFVIPGDTLQAWDLHFNGDLQGQSVTLDFHYDDTGMLSWMEPFLTVYHFVNGVPVPLTTVGRDLDNNTITVTTSSFSTFAIGAPQGVPEPSTLALLACGLLGLSGYAWRRRGHKGLFGRG